MKLYKICGGTVIHTSLMPKGICMNLFGTLWVRDPSWINKYVVNHERIHTAQMWEMLIVPFYIVYILEWLVRLLRYRNHRKAYMKISFEREAYSNDRDLGYLRRRHHYAWLRYLK